MSFTYWITTVTDTQNMKYLEFPRQQWLRERATLLGLYVHCRSCLISNECRISDQIVVGTRYQNPPANSIILSLCE